MLDDLKQKALAAVEILSPVLKPVITPMANWGRQAEKWLDGEPDAFILPGFERILQFDGYTCGMRSAEMVLRYHRKRYSEVTLKHQLKTDADDGTDSNVIAAVLRRRYGLMLHDYENLSKSTLCKHMLKHQVPAMIGLRKGKHYGVVFGVSAKHVWVADPNPALRPRCRWTWAAFCKEWDKRAAFVCNPSRAARLFGRDAKK